MPAEITSAKYPSLFVNSIERNGRVLPLELLISIIIAGVGALATAEGATANAVFTAKIYAKNEQQYNQLDALVPGASFAASDTTKDQTESSLLSGAAPVIPSVPPGVLVSTRRATRNTDEELVERAISFVIFNRFTVSLH